MTHRRWWGGGMVGLLMLAVSMGGCSDGGGDGRFQDGNVCLLFGEQEPNATAFTAQLLGDILPGECFAVTGGVFDVADVDSYRVLIDESLTLTVTLEHSPLVDFDVQLFDADTGRLLLDCGINVVPEVCVVPFVVRASGIAVDVVVTSFIGAGTYTLSLEAQ